MNEAKTSQDTITESWVETFDRQGYVVIPDVIDTALIEELKGHIEYIEKKYPNRRAAQVDHFLVKDDPFWLRVASDDRLLDVAEKFVGPNIALYASTYFSKAPFSGEAVLWHQDGVYWPLEPMNVVTLWLAVDDSFQENGCLRVIPGTHKMDFKEYAVNKDVPNALESQIDTRYVDESKAVDIILKSGSVSIHHPNIIHGSKANSSAMRRCGLTLRYIPTSTEILTKPWECQFLLRGEAVPGINQYMQRPKYMEGESFPFRGSEAWK